MPIIPLILLATGGAVGAWSWNKIDDAVIDPMTGQRPLFNTGQVVATLVVVGAGVYLAKRNGFL